MLAKVVRTFPVSWGIIHISKLNMLLGSSEIMLENMVITFCSCCIKKSDQENTRHSQIAFSTRLWIFALTI